MPRAQKWLWTAHEEEWGPIKRIRMVSPDLEHGFPERSGFSGTLLPLFIEIHHEARSRFVVHVPQTEQQRLGARVQKSRIKPSKSCCPTPRSCRIDSRSTSPDWPRK